MRTIRGVRTTACQPAGEVPPRTRTRCEVNDTGGGGREAMVILSAIASLFFFSGGRSRAKHSSGTSTILVLVPRLRE